MSKGKEYFKRKIEYVTKQMEKVQPVLAEKYKMKQGQCPVLIWLNSDLYLHYHIEDLITPHYWSCSVLIILTNQLLLFCDCKLAKRFCHLQKYRTAFKIRYLIGWNHDAISRYKVHTKFTWTRSVMESSDPQCDGINRGLTLVPCTKLNNLA